MQQYTHGQQGDIKIDWAPTDKDRLFARYSQQHVEKPIVNSEPFEYSGSGSGLFPLQSAVLGYTRTFNSRVVNDFRLGMNYFPAEDQTQSLTTAAAARPSRASLPSICRDSTLRLRQIGGKQNVTVRLRHYGFTGSVPSKTGFTFRYVVLQRMPTH